MTLPRALRVHASIIRTLTEQRFTVLSEGLAGAPPGSLIVIHSVVCQETRAVGPCSCFPAILPCGARA